jgi:hypothetical protein
MSSVGCHMNRNKAPLLVLLIASVAAVGCSGATGGGCKVNCTVGDATVSFTLSAVPIAPQPGTSILSFAVTLNGIKLTPASGGTDVNIPLNSATYVVDLTRLQSDSAFAGQVLANVPAGTYNQITVGVASAVVTYCTNAGISAGCDPLSVKQVSQPFTTVSPATFSAIFSSNQQTGLQIRFDIGKALTINAVTQVVTAVNLNATGVMTTATLPPVLSSLAAGQLDFVEDFTGVVTAASATSVTVQTSLRGAITAKVTATTITSSTCVINNNAGCASPLGQVASIDTVLNNDGTFSLLEYDPLDVTSSDIVEGIVTATPLTSTQFDIVANDILLKSASSLIGTNLSVGAPVHVTLSPTVFPFAVDSKNLPVVITSFGGSVSATDILPGQTVGLRVTNFTAATATVPAQITVDAVVLRFTRVAGGIFSVTGPTFNITSLPRFYNIFTSLPVQLSSGSPSTYYDGVTSPGNLIVGHTAAMRALYFGPAATPGAFTAAKVRQF